MLGCSVIGQTDCFQFGGLGANRNVSGKLSVKLAIKGNGIVVPFLKCYTGNVECGGPCGCSIDVPSKRRVWACACALLKISH